MRDVACLYHTLKYYHPVTKVSEREGHHVLGSEGMAERLAQERTQPGRPKVLYRASPATASPIAAEYYRGFAGLLAQGLAATSDPAAVDADERWAQAVARRPRKQPGAPWAAADEVRRLLGDLGIDPEPGVDPEPDVGWGQIRGCGRAPGWCTWSAPRSATAPARTASTAHRAPSVCPGRRGAVGGGSTRDGGCGQLTARRPFVATRP